MRAKLHVELLGTFFLCFGVLMTNGAGAPLMVAALLCALIYMGGPVSGAHYNPAVSVAFRLRGRLAPGVLLPYVGVQVLAATLAAALAGLLLDFDPDRATALTQAVSAPLFDGFLPLVVAEVLGTGLLAFVILMVATSRHSAGNSYYGVAIALTVLGLAGVFSGAGPDLNPAVTLAHRLTGLFATTVTEGSFTADFLREWAFLAKTFPRDCCLLLCQLTGGLLAARLFLRLFPEER